MQKLRLAEKYIRYQDTRERNVNVSWFGVTRTPKDAPNTLEDAPVVFRSTFRELPSATGIGTIEACIQKLWLAEKYIKYQDTHGRNVNVSCFGVTRTPEDAPKTPEDAPVVFVDMVLRGPFGGLDNVFCDRSLSCQHRSHEC